MTTSYTIEHRMAFLFEEWSEPYLHTAQVNNAEEKVIVCQEPLRNSWLIQLSGKGGV